MPRTSRRTSEMMREQGFISVMEAAAMTGAATTTLYARLARGNLVGRRAGMFHFVLLASLEAEYPHVKPSTAESPAAEPHSTEAA